MMVRDRAAHVALAIGNLVDTVRHDVLRGDELRRRIEDLLREEFADERRQGVADRGDANL
jgi:hypothetical protein